MLASMTPQILEKILIFGVPIVAVICVFAWMTIRAVAEIALKRDMVARGMSVEEMKQVLRSGRKL